MKVNISDLLDEFTPGEDLELLNNDKKSINLNTIKHSVNKSIAKSEGGQIMKFNYRKKLAAACIAGLGILSLGGITVNAATNGALFNSMKIFLVNEDGTKNELAIKNSHVEEDGSIVFSIDGNDNETITVKEKGKADSATTTIESDKNSDISISSSETITLDSDQNTDSSISGRVTVTADPDTEEIYISKSESQKSILKNSGIDPDKYKEYKPGTYEETGKDGVKYEIKVSEDGSIHISSKK
jgi:hypothetical protein